MFAAEPEGEEEEVEHEEEEEEEEGVLATCVVQPPCKLYFWRRQEVREVEGRGRSLLDVSPPDQSN